jgi:hypothetical protein
MHLLSMSSTESNRTGANNTGTFTLSLRFEDHRYRGEVKVI